MKILDILKERKAMYESEIEKNCFLPEYVAACKECITEINNLIFIIVNLKAEDAPQLEEPREISGTIAETGEPCKMRANGYWTGERGRHITSYERTDKQEYNKDGKPVYRQYSMDRHRRFYLETEDEKHDY